MLQPLEIESLQTKSGDIRRGVGKWGRFTHRASSRFVEMHWDNPDDKNRDMSDGDVWLKWSELFKDTRPERFRVPCVFPNIEAIQNRRLQTNWSKGPLTLERWSQLLHGLQMFGEISSPVFDVQTIIKVYSDLPHGLPSNHRYLSIRGEGFYPDAKRSIYATSGHDLRGKITAAFSWKVILKPRERGLKSMDLIFPVADLNIRDEESIRQVANILAANGYSGSLFRTGESGHFMADFLIPSSLGPRVAGKLMEILSPASNLLIQSHARRYFRSANFREAQSVANDILRSSSELYANSIVDVRYFGHTYAHNHGLASLRFLDAKKYGFNPYELCRIQ